MAGDLNELDWEAVERLYQEMESQGRAMLDAVGVDPHLTQSARRAEMRYAGQFHDIEVPVPERLAGDAAGTIRERFDAEYARLYNVTLPGYAVQALNWRVRVTGPAPVIDIRGSFGTVRDAARTPAAPPMAPRTAAKAPRQIYIPESGGFVEVRVYDRYRMPEGSTLAGPAIIEEAEATTLLWPGDRLTVDPQRNLVIHVGVASAVTAAAGTGVPR